MSSSDSLETLMKVEKIYEPPRKLLEQANLKDREGVYKESIKDPEKFWDRIAKELEWYEPWTRVLEWEYPWAKWYLKAKCNIVHNALDRHATTWRKNKVAIYWEGEIGDSRTVTYSELYRDVNKFANVLKKLGVAKSDRVTIYMPRVPEQVVAMLACAKIGAIHSVVYSGFSSGALRDRIVDAEAKVVVTADGAYYRGKVVPLADIVGQTGECPSVKHAVVFERTKMKIKENPSFQYHSWEELMNGASSECQTERMDSEDPLYFLYTSGTTGRPKGVVHVHGGYMVGTYITTKWIFDIKDEDVYWCTADPGWVTGHSYIVYGPLINGASEVFYEGAPDYPDPSRWWSIVEKYGVTIFYSTPTAIRALMRFGEQPIAKHNISTLRLLGTVGEPINPEAWIWYHKAVGKSKCPIMDTWWQTETGMAMITPTPTVLLKPGSATKPFPGIVAEIIDKDGNPLPPNKGGMLAIKSPWPSMMRTIYKDPSRYETYWKTISGWYVAGDVASKDEDGYFWIKGRSDDVIKTAGYRIGTAEVESALVSFPPVAEAAVIGKPDPVKGEAIKAFVILKVGHKGSEQLIEEMKQHVRKVLGPIGVPAEIQVTDWLPKTRSGKIMRRVLKAKELGKEVGDTSTLEE